MLTLPKLGLLGVGVVVLGIVSSIFQSSKSAQESIQETQVKLESLHSEIGSLNDDLSEVKQRMEELQNKAPLTFSEQQELSRLENITAQMERQLALKKLAQDQVAKDNAANAAASITQKEAVQVGETTFEKGPGNVIQIPSFEYVDQIDKIYNDLETLEDLKSKLASAVRNDDQPQRDAIKASVENNEANIKSQISDLITASAALYDSETGMVIEGYESLASRLDNLFRESIAVLDPFGAIAGIEKSIPEMRTSILSKLAADQGLNLLAPLGSAAAMSTDRDPLLEYLLTASDETIEIVYTLIASNQSGSWTLEDFQNAVDEFQKTKLEIPALTTNVGTFAEEQELLSQIANQNSTLSIDQYKQLIGYSSDYAGCLSVEGDRITLHEESVAKLTESREKEIQAKIEEGKANKYLEYHKLNQELNNLLDGYDNYNTATQSQVSSTLAEMETIASEINQYYLLEQQLLGTSNAFDNYRNSKSAPSPEDEYNTGLSAMEDLKKGFSEQRFGTAEFEAGARLLIPEDIIDQGVASMKKYYDDTLQRYFTGDDEGITKFVQDSLEKGLLVGDTEHFEVAEGVKLENFVDQLNLTRETALSLFGDLESYTFGQTFDWSDELIDNAANNYNALELLEAQALATKASMIEDGSWNGTSEEDQERTSQVLENLEEIRRVKAELAEPIAEGLLTYDSETEKLANLRQNYDRLIEQINSSEITDEQKINLIANADILLDQIAEIEQGLTEPTEMNIQIAKEYLENEISSAKEELSKQKPGSTDYQKTQDRITNLESSLEKINSFNSDPATTAVNQIITTVQQLTSFILRPKDFQLSTFNAQIQLISLSAAIAAVQALASLGATFKINTISTNSVTSTENKPSTGGTSRGGGRGFHNGTAHARGKWGTSQRETALTGELGQELIVYGDKYWTVGDRGAEFATIPKGAIVFNHRQTEELFKNGYVTSGGGRGKAYSKGTFSKSGDAFLRGYGGSPAFGSSNDSNSVSEKKTSKSTSSKSKAVSDAEDSFEELVDWIVRKLDVLKARTEQFLNAVESAVSVAAKKANFDAAFQNMTEHMRILTEAAARYQQQADSSGLSDEYKELVRSGRIDLETITDEDLKEAIDTFQDFYDKAQDCSDELVGLRDDIRNAAEDFANLRLEEAEEKIDRLDDAMSRLESAYKHSLSLTEKNNLLDQQTQNLKNQLDIFNNTLVDANTQLAIQIGLLKNATGDQFLSAFEAKEKIDTSSLSGDTLILAEKYNALLSSSKEAYQKASEAADDYTDAIRENAKAKLENLQTDLENQNGLLDSKRSRYETQLDLLEARGDSIGSAYYQRMQEISKQERSSLEAANRELQTLLDKEVAQGTIVKGSEDWYDLTEQILDNANAIDGCTKNILEMQQAMDEIKWDHLERKLDAFQNLTDETDFLLGLLERQDLVDQSTGAYTEAGIASAGLIAQKLAIARQSMKEYQKALEDLDAAAAKSGANQMGNSGYNAYMEKRNELMGNYRDAISDAYSYEDEMMDLIQNKLDAEADAYEEILDKRKEALKTTKEEAEYQKNIAEQTGNIQELERQLAALEGNDSDYAKKRRKQLKADLADAEEKLADTEADKKYEIQVDVLDQDFEDFKTSLDEYAKDTKTALGDLTSEINSNVSTVQSSLETLAGETGYQISTVITDVWATAGNAVTSYSGTVADAGASVTARLEEMSNAYDEMAARVAQATESMLHSIDKQNEAVTKQNNGTIQSGQVNNGTNSDEVSAAVDKDKNYILGLYRDLLGREADAGGLASWLAAMASGMSAEEVRQGFLNSEEYRRMHGESGASGSANAVVTAKSGVNIRSSQSSSNSRNLLGALPNGTEVEVLEDDGHWLKIRGGGLTGWAVSKWFRRYAAGTRRAGASSWAWTSDGNGDEIVISPNRRAVLTPVAAGDIIPNADLSRNLFAWGAYRPEDFIQGIGLPGHALPAVSPVTNITIPIEAPLVRVDGIATDEVAARMTKQMDQQLKNFGRDMKKSIQSYTVRR